MGPTKPATRFILRAMVGAAWVRARFACAPRSLQRTSAPLPACASAYLINSLLPALDEAKRCDFLWPVEARVPMAAK